MNRRKLGILVAVGAGIAAASATGTAAAIAWSKADPHWVSKTSFGPLTVRTVTTPSGDKMRLMKVKNTVQGASYFADKCFELPFEYLRATARVMREVGVVSGSTLCLGGGAYALPKYLVAHYPEATVEVVEIDPRVTEAARKWFFLGELERRYHTRQAGTLRLTHAEAGAFLEYSSEQFDCVFNDVFAAARPLERLATPAGAALIGRHVKPEGIYIANVVASAVDAGPLQQAASVLRAEFAHVYVVDASDVELTNTANYLVVASNRELELPHTIVW